MNVQTRIENLLHGVAWNGMGDLVYGIEYGLFPSSHSSSQSARPFPARDIEDPLTEYRHENNFNRKRERERERKRERVCERRLLY